MDKSYPAKAPMVVRSIDLEKDIFRPRPDIGALMFLANSTRPDIAFAVNLLARHSAAPMKHHCVGGKQILRYLNGTKDLDLFYKKNQDPTLIGYTNAGYLSDPHNAISQT